MHNISLQCPTTVPQKVRRQKHGRRDRKKGERERGSFFTSHYEGRGGSCTWSTFPSLLPFPLDPRAVSASIPGRQWRQQGKPPDSIIVSVRHCPPPHPPTQIPIASVDWETKCGGAVIRLCREEKDLSTKTPFPQKIYR